MTIGPAPMMRIEEMSVRLGISSVSVVVIPGRGRLPASPKSIFTGGGYGFRARPSAVPE
ncbi:MAG: hypothetical protein ACLQFW_05885 [Xanthobacteraceae bacterium]